MQPKSNPRGVNASAKRGEPLGTLGDGVMLSEILPAGCCKSLALGCNPVSAPPANPPWG